MLKLIALLWVLSPQYTPIHTDELRCLTDNIYFEARNQTVEGQLAVAHVTFNRVEDQRFPDKVCDVVKQQGRSKKTGKTVCQFSWYCDGKSDIPNEAKSYKYTKSVAQLAWYSRGLFDPTAGATFYHANYIQPKWSRLVMTKVIDDHIFYKSR